MIDQNKIHRLGPLNPRSDDLPIMLSDGSLIYSTDTIFIHFNWFIFKNFYFQLYMLLYMGTVS